MDDIDFEESLAQLVTKTLEDESVETVVELLEYHADKLEEHGVDYPEKMKVLK